MNAKVRGITVTINGDTKGLGKVLDAAKKQSMGLSKELREVNKALKFNPSSVTLLSEKQAILADSVKAAREELKALEAAQGDVERMYNAGEIDRGAYLEFQRKLEAARANLKRLQDQQVEFGGVVGQIMQQAGQSVTDFGNKIADVGEKLMPISAATAAAGAASVKMAFDFEDSMAKVSTIADTAEVPLEELEAAILELSDESGIAAGEIAENVYNAISAGQKTGDAVNFVRYATDLARAGFAESGDALDLLTTIMNAYKLEAGEVVNVSDILIATQNLGKTTVAELSASMGKIIPTANAAGVQLDQVAAGYALMTANGVATAESTTYMNSMLNELNKSGTTVSDTLKNQTGKSFSELMAEGYTLGDVLGIINTAAMADNKSLMDMFGSAEAAKAGLILLGNDVSAVENGLVEAGGAAGDFNNMLAGIRDGSGGTASALEKLDTNNRKIAVALNQAKNAALDFGQVAGGMLAPYIEKFAGLVEQATDKLKNMDEGQKKTIVTIAAIVAAAGPLLTVVGKGISLVGGIITGGGKIVSTFTGAAAALKGGATAFSLVGTGAKVAGVALTVLSSPITWVVAGIAGLIALFVTLYNKCEWFRDGVNNVASEIQTGWNNMTTAVSTAHAAGLEAMHSTSANTLARIQGVFAANGGSINGVTAEMIAGITGLFSYGFTFIDTLTGGKLSEISNKFSTYMDEAKETVSDTLDRIKQGFSDKIDSVKETVSSGLAYVRNLFNFEWSLPHINLPHFSVSGGEAPWGFGGEGSLPHISVSWHREGGILNGAQIFGKLGSKLLGGGEAGPEAVLPLRSFYDELSKILNKTMGYSAGNGVDARQLLAKLDGIYERLGRLQMVMDTGTLVGAIADPLDNVFAEKQLLADRGI